MMKLEGRQVKWLAQGHTGIKWQDNPLISNQCLFLETTESNPMLLPSGTEEPKPDIMGTRLLANAPGQEALWLDEL